MRCLTFHDYLTVGKVKAISADPPQSRVRSCLDTVALVIFSKPQSWLPASRVILSPGPRHYHQMISLSGGHPGDGHTQGLSRSTINSREHLPQCLQDRGGGSCQGLHPSGCQHQLLLRMAAPASCSLSKGPGVAISPLLPRPRCEPCEPSRNVRPPHGGEVR